MVIICLAERNDRSGRAKKSKKPLSRLASPVIKRQRKSEV